MTRYYVEFKTNTSEPQRLSPPISFYIYARSPDQVRDQFREYKIITLDATE